MDVPMYVTTFDNTDSKISLDNIATDAPKDLSREAADGMLGTLGTEMFELQELLWGARTHAVLIVLQGMDTSGKDGAIKNVAGFLNPRGISVVSFGVPTKEESSHDGQQLEPFAVQAFFFVRCREFRRSIGRSQSEFPFAPVFFFPRFAAQEKVRLGGNHNVFRLLSNAQGWDDGQGSAEPTSVRYNRTLAMLLHRASLQQSIIHHN